MNSNSQVPSTAHAVSTAIQLMMDNLPDDQAHVVAVRTLPYLAKRCPAAMGEFTGEPICKRKVISCSQESQIERLMTDSGNFNLAIHLNDLVNQFNGMIGYFKAEDISFYQTELAKNISKFGGEIVLGIDKDSCGEERSKQYTQWREAIEILSEGCISLKSSEISGAAHGVAHGTGEGENSKLNQFFDKLREINPNTFIQTTTIANAVERNYYNSKSMGSLSKLILAQFIGNGDVKIFRDTLQSLLEYHNFIPEHPLVCVTSEQATLMQAAAAKRF